jgi:ornithine carbamoyltransferase
MVNHFLTLADLGSDGVREVLSAASVIKTLRGTAKHPRPLESKSAALIFEKASTRTRVSFEVAIHELGGQAVALPSSESQIGRGEPLSDTARVLSRYVHVIVYRTFGQERIEELAGAASVPVVNALTDSHHPCQILADLLTVLEHRSKGLDDLRVAWIGDGNNVANSWIEAASLVGFELRLACPTGFEPDRKIVEAAHSRRKGNVLVGSSPAEAVKGADVVTTDVWASMGQENEAAGRKSAFANFTVNAKLMKLAQPSAIFLHCLPAHRGEEVTADVIDGPGSRIWDEAENRLHVQKALLIRLCES